ncbi:MAG: hypothetical protein KDB60_18380 [Propionibacteriaceae bacterium]|nr:hypothetical protein [Propionibacteriaceae bacterium]
MIVAFCTHWNSGGGTSEPTEPTPTPSIPKGVEPPDVPDPVSCDDLAALESKLNERIADDRKQAIAGEITVSADEVAKNAARRDLDDAAADATNAVAAEATAQEAYARAVGGYYYREVIRYGKELLIKAPYPRGEIDRGIAEGQALLDAMDAVSHALQDEHAAQYDYQHAAATWAADKQALDALYDEIARLEQQLQDIARDKETCTK